MPFDNKHFIGVNRSGYFVALPIKGQITDNDAIEIAALIVAMKPALRPLFEARLKAMDNGE
jgi:uncharacterized pyridoxamine 5'-phosphate oxidase family protein